LLLSRTFLPFPLLRGEAIRIRCRCPPRSVAGIVYRQWLDVYNLSFYPPSANQCCGLSPQGTGE